MKSIQGMKLGEFNSIADEKLKEWPTYLLLIGMLAALFMKIYLVSTGIASTFTYMLIPVDIFIIMVLNKKVTLIKQIKLVSFVVKTKLKAYDK